MAETKKTLTQRKTEAKAEAVPHNELVAYVKHFTGFEDQYGYGEFLEDCKSPDAPSRKWVTPETKPEPVPEPVPQQEISDVE